MSSTGSVASLIVYDQRLQPETNLLERSFGLELADGSCKCLLDRVGRHSELLWMYVDSKDGKVHNLIDANKCGVREKSDHYRLLRRVMVHGVNALCLALLTH